MSRKDEPLQDDAALQGNGGQLLQPGALPTNDEALAADGVSGGISEPSPIDTNGGFADEALPPAEVEPVVEIIEPAEISHGDVNLEPQDEAAPDSTGEDSDAAPSAPDASTIETVGPANSIYLASPAARHSHADAENAFLTPSDRSSEAEAISSNSSLGDGVIDLRDRAARSVGPSSANDSREIAKPLPRVIVMVTLARVTEEMHVLLESDAQRMADRYRKIAKSEIEQALWWQQCERRAADHQLRR